MAKNLFFIIVSLFKSRSDLVIENLALRQQLSIYHNSKKRPKIRLSDQNHMHNTYAIDFFIVPTATFRALYVFIVLWHENRNIIHFNVTEEPNAKWAAQQIIEAVHGRQFPNTCSGIGMEFMGRFFRTGLKEWESRK